MSQFQLYQVSDEGGYYGSPIELNVPTDEVAIEASRHMLSDVVGVEIWSGQRFVGSCGVPVRRWPYSSYLTFGH